MVQQKDINLNMPLDASAPAQIRKVALSPELATAALTLHGDYYRQLQGKCNSTLVWHPLSLGYIALCMTVVTLYAYTGLYQVLDSVSEFLRLAARDKDPLIIYFPAMIFIAGTVGIAVFYLTDDFRAMSDGLAKDEYMSQLFRFPLRIFANARDEDLDSALVRSASRSTDLIEYRNQPIAVVTVVPLPDESSKTTFVAKITGLHARKAYRKAGLEFELVEYAQEKARALATQYVEDNGLKVSKITVKLLADAYTCDPHLCAIYKEAGFTIKQSLSRINWFEKQKSPYLGYFKINRLTHELEWEHTLGPAAKLTDNLRKRK